jgi:hypothetical protein
MTPDQLYHLDDEEFFNMFPKDAFTPYTLIHDVSKRRLYKTLYEHSYDPDVTVQNNLADLSYRLNAEDTLSKALGLDRAETSTGKDTFSSIIIDIPERISFEFDLPVIVNGEYVPYAQSGPVFTTPVIRRFTESLRKIRVLGPPIDYNSDHIQKINDFFKTA